MSMCETHKRNVVTCVGIGTEQIAARLVWHLESSCAILSQGFVRRRERRSDVRAVEVVACRRRIQGRDLSEGRK